MSVEALASAPKQIWIPFFIPVPAALRRVEAEFLKGERIVQIIGYPKKVFCVHLPEDNASLLRDREVGEIKYPGLLPRVKLAMRTGGYIQEGGPAWRERRRQVQDAFRSGQLKRYAEQVPEKTRQAFDRWNLTEGRSATLDAAEEMRLIITATNLRMFFSDDAQGERLQRITDWTHFVEYHFVGVMPLWVPTPTNRKFLRCMHALRSEFESIVHNRMQVPSDRRDLLTVLLSAQSEQARKDGSVDEIVDESFSVFFGASVMAVTLTFALYLLAKAPELQDDFRSKIKAWLDGRSGEPASLVDCPECDIFVKETLRHFPASWGYPRHCRAGMQLAGAQIPAGSIVIPMIEHAHHDPALWRQTEQFCPARFESEEGKANLSQYTFLPFGMGSRMCLGANLAPMVMKTVLGMIVRSFEIGLADTTPTDLKPSYGFEIQPPGAVKLTFRRLA